MRVSLGDVSLWFDASGPSVIPQGDTTVERPVLVAVHGGPGLDHMTVKSALEPLAADFQVPGCHPRERHRGRAFVTQQLAYRRWQQREVSGQLIELVGVLQQDMHGVADKV